MIGKRKSTLSWAQEAVENSIDGATGLPDTAGLTFAAAPVSRVAVGYDGQTEPALKVDHATGSGGMEAPEVETAGWSAGVPQQRRFGTIKLDGEVMTPSVGDQADTFLHAVLSTSLGFTAVAAETSDAVAAANTASSWTATDASKYVIGAVVMRKYQGRVEQARITNKVGSVITVAPAFSSAPANGNLINMCTCYYPEAGTPAIGGSPNRKPLALRMDSTGIRWTAVGCRMQSLDLSLDGEDKRTLRWAASMMSPLIQDDNASASIGTLVPATVGSVCTHLMAEDVYSAAFTNTAPVTAARTRLTCTEWSAHVECGLSPRGHGTDMAGIAGYDVTKEDGTLTVLCQPVAAFTTMRLKREARTVFCTAIGVGPDTIQGVGFLVSNATLQDPMLPELDDEKVMHHPTFTAGPWRGSNATTAMAKAPWIFAVMS